MPETVARGVSEVHSLLATATIHQMHISIANVLLSYIPDRRDFKMPDYSGSTRQRCYDFPIVDLGATNNNSVRPSSNLVRQNDGWCVML